MAIVQSINSVYQFRDAFHRAGQMEQFSYEGLEVLFNYLEELSKYIGEAIELDVIGLCCEYCESSIEELIRDNNIDISDAEGDEEEIKEIVKDYLQYYTSVCGEVPGGFVYAAF